ncbi:Protein kinase domain-containing protein [Mycena kentingensis (nom. inval.)]|nr:Protein kinase domain-containing protein [Mycena kentingensis (nom. inval.)]
MPPRQDHGPPSNRGKGSWLNRRKGRKEKGGEGGEHTANGSGDNGPGARPILFGQLPAESLPVNDHISRHRKDSVGAVNVVSSSLGASSRAAMQSVASLVSVDGRPRPTSSSQPTARERRGSRPRQFLQKARDLVPSILKKPSVEFKTKGDEIGSESQREANDSSVLIARQKRVSFSFDDPTESTKRPTTALGSVPGPAVSTPNNAYGRSRAPSMFQSFRKGKDVAEPASGPAQNRNKGQSRNHTPKSPKQYSKPERSFVDRIAHNTASSGAARIPPPAAAPPSRSPHSQRFHTTDFVPPRPTPVSASTVSFPRVDQKPELAQIQRPSFARTTAGVRQPTAEPIPARGPTVAHPLRRPRISLENMKVPLQSTPPQRSQPTFTCPLNTGPIPRVSETCKYWVHESLLQRLWSEADSQNNERMQQIIQRLCWAPHERTNIPPAIAGVISSAATKQELISHANCLALADEALSAPIRADRHRMKAYLITNQTMILDSEQRPLHVELLAMVADLLDQRAKDEQPKAEISLRKLVIELSVSCLRLPGSLLIRGVRNRTPDRVAAGGFGDIYRAEYEGRPVALKQVRLYEEDLLDSDKINKMGKKFLEEALLWKYLQHPHILPFLGLLCEPAASTSFSLRTSFMVCPWMRNGTITRYLKNDPGQAIDVLLLEVANGLQYLHSQGVVHGDLRGVNILIDDDGHVQLADFGIASYEDATLESSTRRGNTCWLAPELLEPEPGHVYRRTRASDVYSFACVCYELYNGAPPFSVLESDGRETRIGEYSIIKQVIDGVRAQTSSKFPRSVWRLIEDCWAHVPMDRLNAEAIVHRLQIINGEQAGRRASLSSDSGPPELYRHPRSRESSLISTTSPSLAAFKRADVYPSPTKASWQSTPSRYTHLACEPSAALNAFLTFGNDSDSDDSTDSDVLAKGRGWNTETVQA